MIIKEVFFASGKAYLILRKLPIYIFTKNDIVEILIERKTMNDLIASIHDGRFKYQKNRILQDILPRRCIYILESTYQNFNNNNMDIINKTINSAIINLMCRDNINVYQTKDIHHTTEIITSIYHKLFLHATLK